MHALVDDLGIWLRSVNSPRRTGKEAPTLEPDESEGVAVHGGPA